MNTHIISGIYILSLPCKCMTESKVIKKWNNSAASNPFSKCGMRAHIQVGEKHYVLSEAWPMDTGYENMLFAADETGQIESFADLWVSYDKQFEEALKYILENPNEIQEEDE